MQLRSQGLKIIFSSPSGTGKTTLTKALLKNDKNIIPSVSVTTRPKRIGEVEGKDYFFITQPQNYELLEKNLLLENAEVFGYCYGSPKKQTDEILASGIDVLYDIDWQGAQQLIKHAPQNIVTIFILPPSMTVLEHRLRNRNSDNENDIQRRLSEAKLEISKCMFYDYVIINDDIDDSLAQIETIIAAERLKRLNSANLQTFLDNFIDGVIEVSEYEISLITNNAYIIDVRELHEWQSGYIERAIHIPLQKLLANDFDLEKSKPCIVYCQHGVRSLTASKFLKDQGFQAMHLKGGVSIWRGKLSLDS
jgi:guanylate kinase